MSEDKEKIYERKKINRKKAKMYERKKEEMFQEKNIRKKI